MRIGTLISGLLLILAGVILFLFNIGYGSWVNIYEVAKYWPILLIIIGIGLLWQGKIPRLIAYLIIIISVIIVGAYMILGNQNSNIANDTKSTLSISRQQYPQVTKGQLDVNYGGGKLIISPGMQGILYADFNNTQVKEDIKVTKNNLNVEISQAKGSGFLRTERPNRWQLEMSPELDWQLNLSAGAIDGHIDLNGVTIRELNCNMGAGNIVFVLGNNGENSKITIEAGASNIKLLIADDTGVKIKVDGALNNNNLDKLGWIKTNDGFISPNYEKADSTVDCDIELSVGNLDVQVLSNSYI